MKTLASIIISFLLLIASVAAKTDIDSLERLLETANSPTQKDTILTRLCTAYLQIDPNIAHKYAARRLAPAEKMKNKTASASSLGLLGNAYRYMGNIDSAIFYMNRSKDLYEEPGNPAEVSSKLNNLGVMYSVESDYERSIGAYKKGIEIDKKIGNESGTANKIGNISGIYFYRDDFETSLKYSPEAAGISSKIGDAASLSYHLANVGLAYRELKKYDSALVYLRKAVAFNDSLGQYSELGKNLTNMAATFSDAGQRDSAKIYFGRALDLIEKMDSKPNAAFLFVNYGMFKSTIGDDKRAVELMRKGYFLARETGYFDLQGQAANSLAKSFENLRQSDSAYDYLRKYQNYLDSATGERTEKIRREFDIEYETEKKELENRLIREREIEVSVIDTGVGFDKETERKIFRIDESHSTQGTAGESGAGLGPALCAEFVRKHGGEISAKGNPGIGAEFKFTLPKKSEIRN